MAPLTRRQRLQREALELLEELWLLAALTKGTSQTLKRRIGELRALVDGYTNREIEGVITSLQHDIRTRRELFGANLGRADIRRIREFGQGSGAILYVPLWTLRTWFARFDERLPSYGKLPSHARLSVDLEGIYPDGYTGEWRLLEAALYEDMALHFNEAANVDLGPDVLPNLDGRKRIKRQAASLRGAVASAFFMVEAYLNSVAFDCVMKHWDELTERERALLTERDVKDESRFKAVSFRDKLLQYPRVYLRAEHPPLQESNCPSMAFVLSEAMLLRDAIVHANPRLDTDSALSAREMAFVSLDLERCKAVVDAAVDLVLSLEAAIHGNIDRFGWMHRRGDSGLFPDEAFL